MKALGKHYDSCRLFRMMFFNNAHGNLIAIYVMNSRYGACSVRRTASHDSPLLSISIALTPLPTNTMSAWGVVDGGKKR
jgi:hypothetical protein